MKSLKGKIFIICAALLLALVAILVSPGGPDPVYNEKHESEWFGDWCKVNLITPTNPVPHELQAAIGAFEHAGPEFVPYLTNQLRYDRSGIVEWTLIKLQNFA